MAKPIRLTRHAAGRLSDRGATEDEVRLAVQQGVREPVREGRFRCRLNLRFDSTWQGKHYHIKQVAPVIVETATEIGVVTVYTFYF